LKKGLLPLPNNYMDVFELAFGGGIWLSQNPRSLQVLAVPAGFRGFWLCGFSWLSSHGRPSKSPSAGFLAHSLEYSCDEAPPIESLAKSQRVEVCSRGDG